MRTHPLLLAGIVLVQSAFLLGATVTGGGGGGAVIGWPTDTSVRAVTDAVSRETAICFGDGTNAICLYADPTLGAITRPKTDGNSATMIWSGFNWALHDVESVKDILIVDPDTNGNGFGTLTLQTGEQLVTSNLGIEFTESDTNPTCSSGRFSIYADTSEIAMKQCADGTPYTLPKTEFIRKVADETVNNSATAQADNVLVFNADASSYYTFKYQIVYSSSTTADFKYEFAFPSGATGWKSSVHPALSATGCASTSTTNSFTLLSQADPNVGGIGTGSANACMFEVSGWVQTGVTAGTVELRWAQATAEASDTVVHTGSNLEWTKR